MCRSQDTARWHASRTSFVGIGYSPAVFVDCGVRELHAGMQINLAPPKALERLSGLLEAAGGGSLTLVRARGLRSSASASRASAYWPQ